MNHLTLSAAICALALLAACGKQETTAPAPAPAPAAAPSPAPAPAPAAAPAPATAPVAASADENAAGKAIFNKTCAVCHAAGVAGAPKPGDKADWAPRLAQGMDVLNEHAIKGFTGSKGAMPPKGGASNLSDDEVKAAVKYMADASR